MKRIFFAVSLLFFWFSLFSQTVANRLAVAFDAFEKDAQLKSGIASLYVMNAKTGAVVFSKNSSIGLATASTLKIITAATAFELLGKNYQYKTEMGIEGDVNGAIPKGHIYVKPSGDPTLGSWRWSTTKENAVMSRFITALKKSGITGYGQLVIDESGWDEEAIPDGWMWQDIGNYYGAGAFGLNWRENQFDVVLRSDNEIGSSVNIVGTVPVGYNNILTSKLTAAARGTGDNAYVYYPLGQQKGVIRGTIPINEKKFEISAAFPDSKIPFVKIFSDHLAKVGIKETSFSATQKERKVIYTEKSPPLDSIIYWFLKKSINLYGEALVKTMAYEQKNNGATNKGVTIIKDFWKEKGIEPTELNIVDGSGLSPLNRVTTHAQVHVLQYAKKQPWFSSFYYALPEYNGMKLKSGTINGVKGFAGYHTSKNGEEFIISFLVNNYNGSAAALVQKMYKVLDVLK